MSSDPQVGQLRSSFIQSFLCRDRRSIILFFSALYKKALPYHHADLAFAVSSREPEISNLRVSESFLWSQGGVSDPHSVHHRREEFHPSQSWLIRGKVLHR
jgi:hypothetical protein